MLTGFWVNLMVALSQRRAVPSALQMSGSTVIRAHHQAAAAENEAPRQGFGRSRGGFTIRIRLRVSGHRPPHWTKITPRQTSDHLGFDLVRADNLPRPSVPSASRGHDVDKIREVMEARNALPVIAMREPRKNRIGVDRSLYRLRNRVERCSNTLKNAKSAAIRYNEVADCFSGSALFP